MNRIRMIQMYLLFHGAPEWTLKVGWNRGLDEYSTQVVIPHTANLGQYGEALIKLGTDLQLIHEKMFREEHPDDGGKKEPVKEG